MKWGTRMKLNEEQIENAKKIERKKE